MGCNWLGLVVSARSADLNVYQSSDDNVQSIRAWVALYGWMVEILQELTILSHVKRNFLNHRFCIEVIWIKLWFLRCNCLIVNMTVIFIFKIGLTERVERVCHLLMWPLRRQKGCTPIIITLCYHEQRTLIVNLEHSCKCMQMNLLSLQIFFFSDTVQCNTVDIDFKIFWMINSLNIHTNGLKH